MCQGVGQTPCTPCHRKGDPPSRRGLAGSPSCHPSGVTLPPPSSPPLCLLDRAGPGRTGFPQGRVPRPPLKAGVRSVQSGSVMHDSMGYPYTRTEGRDRAQDKGWMDVSLV